MMVVDGKGMKEGAKKISEKLGKHKYTILVLLLGVLLILWPSGKERESETEVTEDTAAESTFSVEETEEKITQMLSSLDGAGKVKVMLTVRDMGERCIASDRESNESASSDGESSERSRAVSETSVVISKGGGGDEVVTLKYIFPEYQGALISAQGADSALVKREIVESVSAVTGLSSEKIKVIKMK